MVDQWTVDDWIRGLVDDWMIGGIRYEHRCRTTNFHHTAHQEDLWKISRYAIVFTTECIHLFTGV